MLTHLKSRADWNERSLSAKGFTLIELLVVIVILGILAAVVVFAVGGITDKGQGAACQSEASTVRVAAEAYFAGPALGNGTYATAPGQLVTAKLITSAPTLVTYAGAGTSYTMTYTAKCTAVTPALPAP